MKKKGVRFADGSKESVFEADTSFLLLPCWQKKKGIVCEDGFPIIAAGDTISLHYSLFILLYNYSTAIRASTSSSRVAQLVTKRTAFRPSGRGSQVSKAAYCRSFSSCAFVRMGNCWLVGESAKRG